MDGAYVDCSTRTRTVELLVVTSTVLVGIQSPAKLEVICRAVRKLLMLGYPARKLSNIPATSLFRTGFSAPGPCGDTAVPTVICSLHAEYALTLGCGFDFDRL